MRSFQYRAAAQGCRPIGSRRTRGRPGGSWRAPGAWHCARAPRWQPACAARSARSGRCGWPPRCWSLPEGFPAAKSTTLSSSQALHRIQSRIGACPDFLPAMLARPRDDRDEGSAPAVVSLRVPGMPALLKQEVHILTTHSLSHSGTALLRRFSKGDRCVSRR